MFYRSLTKIKKKPYHFCVSNFKRVFLETWFFLTIDMKTRICSKFLDFFFIVKILFLIVCQELLINNIFINSRGINFFMKILSRNPINCLLLEIEKFGFTVQSQHYFQEFFFNFRSIYLTNKHQFLAGL